MLNFGSYTEKKKQREEKFKENQKFDIEFHKERKKTYSDLHNGAKSVGGSIFYGSMHKRKR